MWSTSGRERRLTTLAETGVIYPLNGTSAAVAFSPGMGGIVATGRTVSRAGVPAASHVLDDTPATRSLALDTTGDRAFLVTGQTFVVWSLRPVLLGVDPAPIMTPGTLGVTGSGLGATSQVPIDGSAVPFTVEDAGRLSVDLPAVAPGPHQLRAVTPWGTSEPILVATVSEPGSVGDYDGNGTTDVAVFRPSTGTWYIMGGPASQFGTDGDIPAH